MLALFVLVAVAFGDAMGFWPLLCCVLDVLFYLFSVCCLFFPFSLTVVLLSFCTLGACSSPGLMFSTLGIVVFIDESNISVRLLGILFISLSIIINLSICYNPCVFLAPFNAQVRSSIALTTVSTGVSVGCVINLYCVSAFKSSSNTLGESSKFIGCRS